MEYYTLNDGNRIPKIGFGTYKAIENEGINAIITALQNGYRLIDGAAKYDNESSVGKAIKQSGIPREDIFITSKVWRENLGYQNTISALEKSLQELQLDYLDLYLIHWPANAKNYTNWQETNAETWRAMEDMQQQGKIKSIGVSNFWQEHLEPLLENANVKPAINQIEFHPGYWQPELKHFCDENNILVQAWSPLARGRIFQNEELKNIAEKYGKSISQIALRWIIEHGAIPIPKSNTEARIIDNINIFDFSISEEDVEIINQLSQMGFSGELPNIWPERLPKED
ncbi:MAG: aldo/keto reductase [Cruoricaptor ignavus]|nr:aldo/keto reductase [Cruoricaptor ignavus]